MALQLLAIAGSALGTMLFVSYRVGQLEGRVLQQLEDHKSRLDRLERVYFGAHAGV